MSGRAGHHRRCPETRGMHGKDLVQSAKHVESRAGTVAVIAIRSNPPRIDLRVVWLSEQLTGLFRIATLFSSSRMRLLAALSSVCSARLRPVADRCRPAPACATRRSSERWSPDRQRLGNGTASGHWIENLAAELLGITLRHGHGSFDGRRDQKSKNRLRTTRGTSVSGHPSRFRN